MIELKEIVKDMEKPHYQALQINTNNVPSIFDIRKNLYDQELQNNLMAFEIHKMPITVKWLCFNNSPKFKNSGGGISFGLSTKGGPNLNTDLNSKAFSSLKSLSVYDKYLFGNIKGDDILGVYDKLHYELPDVKEVRTYTIVYIVNSNTLREVTKHDFGSYGNILTNVDLKLE